MDNERASGSHDTPQLAFTPRRTQARAVSASSCAGNPFRTPKKIAKRPQPLTPLRNKSASPPQQRNYRRANFFGDRNIPAGGFGEFGGDCSQPITNYGENFEVLIFDLRQEGAIRSGACAPEMATGYAPGECLGRLIKAAADFPMDVFPFPDEFLGEGPSAAAMQIIPPAEIKRNLPTLRDHMQQRRTAELPDAVQLHYRRLFQPSATQADINDLATAGSQSQALIRAVITATGLQAVADDNYFSATVEYLRHKESLVEKRLVRLHNLTICPQSFGKTPVFNLTTRGLSALKKDRATRHMYVLNQENNVSEYIWFNEFELQNCYHLQASDEMMQVLNPTHDATKGPRASMLLRGFLDGFLHDRTMKNRARTNNFTEYVRVNRSGFLQVDAAEYCVFDVIRIGDSGLYKRCEIGYFDAKTPKAAAEQIPIEYAIADLRRLQLEGVIRCYGHACNPTNFVLTDAAREILHNADRFLKTLADLFLPTQRLINDGINHLYAHAAVKAMCRVSDTWIQLAAEADRAQIPVPGNDPPIVCFCKTLALRRPLNLPCFREKISPQEYGEMGYVCTTWLGKEARNLTDCCFVLPTSQKDCYAFSRPLRTLQRSECTTLDCESLACTITSRDAALAVNHFVRGVATLQLQLSKRGFKLSDEQRATSSDDAIDALSTEFSNKHLELQRQAVRHCGYINRYALDSVFGRGKWQDDKFHDHRALGGAYGVLLLGDEEEWMTRKQRKSWRRLIVTITSDWSIFRELPNLAQCATDVIHSARKYLVEDDADLVLLQTDRRNHDANASAIGTTQYEICEVVNETVLRKRVCDADSETRDTVESIITRSASGEKTTYKKLRYGHAFAPKNAVQSLESGMREAAFSKLGQNIYEYKQENAVASILYRKALRADATSIAQKCILLPQFLANTDAWVKAVASYYAVAASVANSILVGITQRDSRVRPSNVTIHFPHVAVLKAEIDVCVAAIAKNDPQWSEIEQYALQRDEDPIITYAREAENAVLQRMTQAVANLSGNLRALVYDSLYFSLPEDASVVDIPTSIDGVRLRTTLVARRTGDKNAIGFDAMPHTRRANCLMFALQRAGVNCGDSIDYISAATLRDHYGICFRRIAPGNFSPIELPKCVLLLAAGTHCVNGVGHAFTLEQIGIGATYRLCDASCENIYISDREVACMLNDKDVALCAVYREMDEIRYDEMSFDDDILNTPMGARKDKRVRKRDKSASSPAMANIALAAKRTRGSAATGKAKWRKTKNRSRAGYRPAIGQKSLGKRKKGITSHDPVRLAASFALSQEQQRGYRYSDQIDQYLQTRSWFKPSKKRLTKNQFHQCSYCGSILHNAISHKHGVYSMCKYDIFPSDELRADAVRFLRETLELRDPTKQYHSLRTPGSYTASGGNIGALATRIPQNTHSILQINQMEISEFLYTFYGKAAQEWQCPSCAADVSFYCKRKAGVNSICRERCGRPCRSREYPQGLTPLKSQKLCPRATVLVLAMRALKTPPSLTCAVLGYDRHTLKKYHDAVHIALAIDQYRRQLTIVYDGSERTCHAEADEYLVCKTTLPDGRTLCELAVGIMQRGVMDSLSVFFFHIVNSSPSMPMTPHDVWQKSVYAEYIERQMQGRVVLHHDGWAAYNSGHSNRSTNNFHPAYEDTVVNHTDSIYWLLDIPTGYQGGTQHIDNMWRQVRRYMSTKSKKTITQNDVFLSQSDDFRAAVWMLQHRGSLNEKIGNIINLLNADVPEWERPLPRRISTKPSPAARASEPRSADYGAKQLAKPELVAKAKLTREELKSCSHIDLRILLNRRNICRPKGCDSKRDMINVLVDGKMPESQVVAKLAAKKDAITAQDLESLMVSQLQALIIKLDIVQSRDCTSKIEMAAKILESQEREIDDDAPFWQQRPAQPQSGRIHKGRSEPKDVARSSWEI